MSKAEKYIVLPFKKVRGRTVPAEMRQATTVATAERMANSMSARFAGVAAYQVTVDLESGDMANPRVLCAYGEVLESGFD
ncbi:hypothetical protein ASE04_27665 [Rhizobium sp. Root708]|uniref:hypothetical protein n=1 Tax=Rhizobium sp. Root708 TaxID=1736592 RepID=UPI0006F28456|nr:hypothetical protein [Rhizobium sp. Root708]KRB58493.1 hypothetical protein ASE04_27665 [Rhizobium sp. Root708]